ncbi:MAG: diguanylate cyclase/phosphodiesterase & domain with sensor(s), partial [Myxococcaceae bacterium]|nr:diguanylate cyclase/phosphodiesterase & domain with sensor(s) [Myxococcaceae bacterium]
MLARVARVGQGLCLAGAALGALGLVGWSTGATILTTLVPDQPPMMPNTALALLVIGAAGALRHSEQPGRMRRTLSLLGATAVLALGVGTFAEYVFDLTLPIDQLLGPGRAGPHPGRPSPLTAVALSFLAAALLHFDFRPTARARPSEWLVVAAGFIAFTAQLGQLFGAGPLYRLTVDPVIGVAVPTALGLLLVSLGLLLERPRAGVMGVVTSPGPGGVLLRRLIPAAVLAPAMLGLLVARILPVVRVEDTRLLLATLAASMTVTGLILFTLTAVALNRTHEALEVTRARTRELIEQAADGIFVADLDGRYTDVNGAGCRMLGFSREEIVGKTIVDLLPPEEVERLLQSKEQLLKGSVHVAEWTLRRKDGTFLPVEVSAKILQDGRWQGFVRDISDRKRAELALQLSEARSTGILSISVDAIISVDEDSRIAMFNEGAEKIFGYSRAEVIGAPLDLLIPERFRVVHRQHVTRFAA